MTPTTRLDDAVKSQLRNDIKPMITTLVNQVRELKVETGLRLDDPYQSALHFSITELFSQWKSETVPRIVEQTAFALAELIDEELDPEKWLTIEGDVSPTLPKSRDSTRLLDERAATPTKRKSKFVTIGRGFGELDMTVIEEGTEACDEDYINGAGVKGYQRAATITKREITRFLASMGYSIVSGNTPHEIWRNSKGARVPVPRHNGDLTRETTKQILKLVSEHLGVIVGIVSGRVQQLEEVR